MFLYFLKNKLEKYNSLKGFTTDQIVFHCCYVHANCHSLNFSENVHMCVVCVTKNFQFPSLSTLISFHMIIHIIHKYIISSSPRTGNQIERYSEVDKGINQNMINCNCKFSNSDGFNNNWYHHSVFINYHQTVLNLSFRGYIKTRSSFSFPSGIYLLKITNRNTRTRCEICSKLTIKNNRTFTWKQ